MIKITNGQVTLTVPASALHQIYAASGFHVLESEEVCEASNEVFITSEAETPSSTISVEETDKSEGSAEYDEEAYEEEEVDLSEIPLSEMDFYQLCDYADQLGLDRKGLRSKKELRALIKNNI